MKIKIKTEWKAIVKDAKTGQILRETDFTNTILNQFKEKLIKAFASDLMGITDTIDDMKEKFNFKYEQLGTDDTASSATDTDLISPDTGTFKQTASISYEGNKLVILSFWEDGEAIGEWKEFALYTADEEAVLRANINQSIESGETLTINGKLTLV
jgi:hypothetical protein